MIAAQGGDARVVDHPGRHLPVAPVLRDVPAGRDGFVADCDAEALGRVALLLGANRRRADEAVDHAVGISRLLAGGARVRRGEALMRLHARDDATAASLLAPAAAAVTIADAPPPATPLVIATLGETP
jgi:thymidine phosphorylase